jgi:hypothetical protein
MRVNRTFPDPQLISMELDTWETNIIRVASLNLAVDTVGPIKLYGYGFVLLCVKFPPIISKIAS